MKINGDKPSIKNEVILNDAKVDKIKAKEVKRTYINSESPDDKINLSPKARTFQKIHQTLKETPDIRAEKVKELKQAIEEGTYKIDAQKIAEKMIIESLE